MSRILSWILNWIIFRILIFLLLLVLLLRFLERYAFRVFREVSGSLAPIHRSIFVLVVYSVLVLPLL